MKEHIIIGTAGHIDHGKSSLIKALTGTDPDRLLEEKERGISIVLGYANLTLPSGISAGIVDVPGHAKFIKTMVSGSTGMDAVILVVAADDGIMAQTVEHIIILKLLGVSVIIPVLTKIDIVDKKTVTLREKQIKELFNNYGLDEDEVIKVSSKTKEGLELLLKKIEEKVKTINFKSKSTKPFMPIDRIFTLKGFGTIVAGTMKYGQFSINDEVEIMPYGIVSKIKSIESHSKSITIAERSMRTALNLSSVEKENISYGDIVSTKNSLLASDTILAYFYYLEGNKKELKNISSLIFMTGSVNLSVKIIIPDKSKERKIIPGSYAYIIIKLQDKITTMNNEKFILRDNSISGTIGGGYIVDPFMDYAFDESKEYIYKRMLSESPEEVIYAFIALDGFSADLDKIYKKMNFSYNDFMFYVDKLIKQGLILADNKIKYAILEENFKNLKTSIIETVKTFIKNDSLKKGIAKNELYHIHRKGLDSSIFDMALNELILNSQIVNLNGSISIEGAVKELNNNHREFAGKIETYIKSSGNSVPLLSEIERKININKKTLNFIISNMIESGRLAKIKYDIFYLREQIDKIKNDLDAFFSTHDKLEPANMKDIAGVSRKYAIPLLEYFDSIGFTIKTGNYRIRKPK